MKMLIDGLSISYMHGTGYFSYAYGLLNNLFYIYPQPNYELLWESGSIPECWNKYKNITYSKVQVNRKSNDYELLEEHLINTKTDLYFSPNNGLSIPQNKVCKYIMTVHDLSPVSCSNLVDNKYYHKFLSLFPDAIKKADSIIAVSEFIKKEIIKFYKIPDKKIEVVYPGCSDIFRPLNLGASKAFLKAHYQIEGRFILYAGSLHSRKNLDVVIKAFKGLLKDINDMKLVIVGSFDSKRREYYLKLKNLAAKLGIDKHIIFTGTVEYNDMPHFYNSADCSVNLSSYDGFPITTIEAAACKTPVVCLRNGSFEEITVPSAVFLDTPDMNLLKNAFIDILSKNEKKDCFKNQSYDQSVIYNWEISAKKLVRIIESTVYDT
ncbi:MAG TPA: glycosyltransferase family 1 protein [Clostridia bacterium]